MILSCSLHVLQRGKHLMLFGLRRMLANPKAPGDSESCCVTPSLAAELYAV
jgi:hypothetical protein